MNTSRRKFMCVAAVTAAGSTLNVGGRRFSWFYIPSKAPVDGIPLEWVELRGIDVYKYGNFIKDLNLKNITPRMVLAPHFKSRKGVINDIPPRSAWKKIAPTLELIDRISSDTGMEIRDIISAYRSPKYNKAVHGKSRSLHMTNQAVDIRFKNTSPWRVARVVRQYRDNKKQFKGGVGLYKSFVHVDTRGYKADW